MTKFNRVFFIINVLMVTFFVACGGGGHHHNGGGGGGSTSSTTTQPVFSPTPLFQVATKHTVTTGSNWSLIPSVHAQAPTVATMTGNYSGFCSGTPVQFISGPTEFVVYGLGRWDDSKCDNNFFNFTNDGAPVIGDGTLQNLVVLGTGGTNPASGTVRVYVNGAVTPITVTLGTQDKVENITDTFVVHDGDNVFVTFEITKGDNYKNLRFFLGKV